MYFLYERRIIALVGSESLGFEDIPPIDDEVVFRMYSYVALPYDILLLFGVLLFTLAMAEMEVGMSGLSNQATGFERHRRVFPSGPILFLICS